MQVGQQMHFGEAEVEETSTRVFVAYLEMGEARLPVGALSVDRKRDSVELVFVQPEYRRRGVAKALLAVARMEIGRELRDTGYRSASGTKWARSVGLESEGRERGLSQTEAEGRGNGLMVPLYTASVRELERPEGWAVEGFWEKS